MFNKLKKNLQFESEFDENSEKILFISRTDS